MRRASTTRESRPNRRADSRYMHFTCYLFALLVLVPAALTAPTYYPSLSPHSINIITTYAGTGTGGYSGDGGQATSADINCPHGIALDSNGNVYFNGYCDHRVRKITTSTGIITTYAGTGTSSFGGDGGVASSAILKYPNGLCIDASGCNQHVLFTLIMY